MRTTLSLFLAFAILAVSAAGQAPQPQDEQEDVVRISSQLVQTDVVVTDKNDNVIDDLKLDDFELYENGKRQELKFMEFVGTDAPAPRVEGALPEAVRSAPTDLARNTSARDLHRIFAPRAGHERRSTAVSFLRNVRRELCQAVAEGTGVHPYAVDQIMAQMIDRCRALRLRVPVSREEAKRRTLIMLTVQTMNGVHMGYHRIPL